MKSYSKARLAFATAVISLIVSAIVAYFCINMLLQNETLVVHTHQVQTSLGTLTSALSAAGRNRTGFIATGDKKYQTDFFAALPGISKASEYVRNLTSDNPTQWQLYGRLDLFTDQRLDLLKESITLKNTKPSDEKGQEEISAKIVELAAETTAVMDQMREEEQRLLQIRVQRSERLFKVTVAVLLVALALSLTFFSVHYQLIFEQLKARNEAEKALQYKNMELEVANRELETFSYSVSHDLRAPLRSIDGFSKALLEDYETRLDPAGIEDLQRIRKSVSRMSDLINDMLKLSRATRATMSRETVNLTSIAENIVQGLRLAHPERQVSVKIAPELMAECDRGLLKIVLENLLENSWKFTGQQPQAEVELGVNGGRDGNVFFVKDNGVGFDMKFADKLFGPFQRLHDPNIFPGTGIGLATTQRIVNRHGGRIWAESSPGQGATFSFTLAPPSFFSS